MLSSWRAGSGSNSCSKELLNKNQTLVRSAGVVAVPCNFHRFPQLSTGLSTGQGAGVRPASRKRAPGDCEFRVGVYSVPTINISTKVRSNYSSDLRFYRMCQTSHYENGKWSKFPALYIVREQSGEHWLCDHGWPLTRPLGRVLTYPSVRCGSFGR